MRVLVVEDDRLLGDALRVGLAQRGFDADWVTDGGAALVALRTEPFSAVVLDVGLPVLDGLEVLRKARAEKTTVPILVLTARDAVRERVSGLDRGADDYVVKPVDLDELAARLRALIRRSSGAPGPVLRVDELSLDPSARSVAFDGRPVQLQAKEFTLLQELMLNAGRVLSREQLEQRLYAWGEEVESNAIEVHIHHLRRKLSPGVITTVRGVGYVIPKAGDE
ncbi:MAG TPA: response regulator [Vicinamibacterales bacterium]|nr:response regulator [Vicinamibacterales bacterium]